MKLSINLDGDIIVVVRVVLDLDLVPGPRNGGARDIDRHGGKVRLDALRAYVQLEGNERITVFSDAFIIYKFDLGSDVLTVLDQPLLTLLEVKAARI